MFDFAQRRGGRGSRRRAFRKKGPVSTLALGIILILASAGIVFDAFTSHSEAAKSAYTQAHGVRATVTVTNVDNEKSCGRSSCDYYAYVTATLPASVKGHVSTTVTVPDNVTYASGQPIAVLVDPKDPGYAELPGKPYQTTGDTICMALIAVVTLGFGVAAIIRGVRMLRARRAERRSALGQEI